MILSQRPWWGLAESAFGGSLESGGRFCVRTFDRNLGSVVVKMSHLLYFINVVLSNLFSKIMLQLIIIQWRAMMMEAVCTSETSVYFNDTTWCYIPEVCHVHTRCQ
jgi:hypothetical protein